MSFLFRKKNAKKNVKKDAVNSNKTNNSLGQKLLGLFAIKDDASQEFFLQMEELFISYDVGVETSLYIIDNFKEQLKKTKSQDLKSLKALLKESLFNMIAKEVHKEYKSGLNIIFVLGVNGVGKTTSVAKLANYLKASQQKSVMLAACDTFRAAAIEQLEVWANRVCIPIVKNKIGSNPGAVLHKAIDIAYKESTDILIVDTAGRFHTKANLVSELEKLSRIITKQAPNAKRENLLVLDSTTGQNAFVQTKEFNKSVGIDGIILTKFDSDAKGGVVLSLSHQLNLPVRFLGIGEDITDLALFNRKEYIEGFLW